MGAGRIDTMGKQARGLMGEAIEDTGEAKEGSGAEDAGADQSSK